jgi:hypothetical protein
VDVAGIVELIERIAADGAPRERIVALRQVRGWLDARELDAVRSLGAEGSMPEIVLSEAGRVGLRDAEAVIARVAVVEAAPALGDALAEGRITAGHVDTVSRAVRALEPEDRPAFLDRSDTLLDAAERLPTDQFDRFAHAERRRVSSQSAAAVLARQVRDTRLRWWNDTASGMLRIAGTFDPLSGAQLVQQLDATRARVEVTDAAPSDPLERSGWVNAQALLMLLRNGGRRADELTVVHDTRGPQPVLDTGTGLELPAEIAEVIRRVARVRVVEIHADGTVTAPGRLDWGRARRTASRDQRDVLRALHPTCGIPGCRVPFTRCDIHHVLPWEHGGATDLANLLPVCPHHHTRIHAEGWTVDVGADRSVTVTYRDGTVRATGPPSRCEPAA